METRHPSDSCVEMTQIVLPTHTNAYGTVFGGQIMAWIDIAGGVAAMRHARQLAVTASMDQLHFLAGAKEGEVVTLRAQVNYTGHTSMEVGVRVESENPVTGEKRHTATAYLAFVAIDANGKPVPVPGLEPTTDDERRRYQKAEARRTARLAARAKVLEREQAKEAAGE